MDIHAYKKQYELCLSMLKQVIDQTDDKMWSQKLGGHVFWQQILHTLMGTYFWFRDIKEEFSDFKEPYKEKGYYPEFEKDPDNTMSREELVSFYETVKNRCEAYFDDKPTTWLYEPAKLYPKLTNAEVITGQIRHVMYHVGYCSALLKENRNAGIQWIDYYG